MVERPQAHQDRDVWRKQEERCLLGKAVPANMSYTLSQLAIYRASYG